MREIIQPYLLVVPSCVCRFGPLGERFVDEMWATDLSIHREYLPNLRVLCTHAAGAVPPGYVSAASDPRLSAITFVDLPRSASLASAIADLPKSVRVLWNEIGRSDVVHCGVVGWPYPLGWIALLLAKWRGCFTLVLVESATWRVQGDAVPARRRIRAALFERINRLLVPWADVSFFTQEGYRRSLLRRHGERGHVIHASWVDDSAVLDAAQASASWQAKRAQPLPLRLLFAGRLVEEKGLRVLLESIRIAGEAGHRIHVDIAGEGPLRTACEAAAAGCGDTASVRVVGTTRYGPDFFALVRDHHAVVVPSLSDEQPRIVYDAFAQGVPVLASDTEGLRSCVHDGGTGRIFPAGSARALAGTFAWACGHVDTLAAMGMEGLAAARKLTHRQMHVQRSRILDDAIRARAGSRHGPMSTGLPRSP